MCTLCVQHTYRAHTHDFHVSCMVNQLIDLWRRFTSTISLNHVHTRTLCPPTHERKQLHTDRYYTELASEANWQNSQIQQQSFSSSSSLHFFLLLFSFFVCLNCGIICWLAPFVYVRTTFVCMLSLTVRLNCSLLVYTSCTIRYLK